MSTTGEEILFERKRRGLSQTEAAVEAGVSQATFCRWENGDQPRGLYQQALTKWLSFSRSKPAVQAEQAAF